MALWSSGGTRWSWATKICTQDGHYPNNAPCEVDVAYDHDVEMPEQLKLLQAHSSLAISWRGVLNKDQLSWASTLEGRADQEISWYDAAADLQVSDGPDHRKKNCSTANKINQHKHLNQSKFATTIFLITLRCFVTSFQKLWPISPRSDSSRMIYATLDMTCNLRMAKVEEI